MQGTILYHVQRWGNIIVPTISLKLSRFTWFLVFVASSLIPSLTTPKLDFLPVGLTQTVMYWVMHGVTEILSVHSTLLRKRMLFPPIFILQQMLWNAYCMPGNRVDVEDTAETKPLLSKFFWQGRDGGGISHNKLKPKPQGFSPQEAPRLCAEPPAPYASLPWVPLATIYPGTQGGLIPLRPVCSTPRPVHQR